MWPRTRQGEVTVKALYNVKELGYSAHWSTSKVYDLAMDVVCKVGTDLFIKCLDEPGPAVSNLAYSLEKPSFISWLFRLPELDVLSTTVAFIHCDEVFYTRSGEKMKKKQRTKVLKAKGIQKDIGEMLDNL